MKHRYPDYPFASHYFDRGDGVRLHFLDEGPQNPPESAADAPTVVMVHGNPTWSFYYRKLVLALRDHVRCIVPDHVGCGLSDKPQDAQYRYTVQSRVEDLEKLLDHLNLRRNLIFVVHDWGGMIGLTTALRRREAVQRVVLMNTSGFLKPTTKSLPLRLRVIRNLGVLGPLLVQGGNAFAWGATHMATRVGLPCEVRRAYCAPYNTWQNRIATLRFVQDIPLKPDDPSYELVKWTDDHLYELAGMPLLICWGRHDFVFDDHFLAEWRRRFPQAETHVFEYAGHYVLEDAADEVIPLMRDFILHRAPPSERREAPRGLVTT